MVQTVLLTLGRLPKALDVARALKSAGCRVIVAEPFGWHLSRVSRAVDKSLKVPAPRTDQAAYFEALQRVIRQERVDLIVPVAEEAMHVAGLGPRLPSGVALFGPDQKTLLGLHDKAAFIKQAARFGLAVPETYDLGTEETEVLAQRGAVIVKRVFSCSGVGLQRVERYAPLPAPGPHRAIVQALVPGPVLSSFSVAHQGRVVGTTVYEPTVLSGTVAVAFRRLTDQTAIEDWVHTFIRRAGVSGFMSFDFIAGPEGPVAIECNPRVTSGVHFIEAESLAQAILAPEESAGFVLRPHRLMQQFYPTLTETQAAVFARRDAKLLRHYLMRSRDVTWQMRDPLPFSTMTFTSYEILRRTIFDGVSFGEAATADIEWGEDDRLTDPVPAGSASLSPLPNAGLPSP